jgi:tetratricopeptide (TPR) repeat protein
MRITTSKTLTIIAFLAFTALTVPGQTPNEEAIKNVIKAETEAYFNSDANGWEATWLHDPDDTRTIVASTSYGTRKGWDTFGPDMVKSLKTAKPTPVEVQNNNYIIRIGGNLAWVEYDQRVKPLGQGTNIYASREYRVLTNHNGEWKIATQITHQTETFQEAGIESTLNDAGYKLLRNKQINDAIEVLKLNAKLYPNSANAYDSLGEALALNGDKAEAIKNYQKSIELNPNSESGKAALAKLKQ